MSVKYLLRFDDLCPTMNWQVWEKVEGALCELKIRPILAVIPKNKDSKLHIAPARSDFWEQVRRWKSYGWDMGMHGFEHNYETKQSGMLRLQDQSEFAGLSRERQYKKLSSGQEILKKEGIDPKIWIAPSHSFDRVTLEILSELGFEVVSDGFSLFPYHDSHGLFWIPQQCWSLRALPFGVFTICLHCNHWTEEQLKVFLADLLRYKHCFTTLEDLRESYEHRFFGRADALSAFLIGNAIRWKKRLLGTGT